VLCAPWSIFESSKRESLFFSTFTRGRWHCRGDRESGAGNAIQIGTRWTPKSLGEGERGADPGSLKIRGGEKRQIK